VQIAFIACSSKNQRCETVGNLTNIDYNSSTDVRLQYDWLNRVTNILDALGTTKYTYAVGNQGLFDGVRSQLLTFAF
jgi:YD repeat-containing protein